MAPKISISELISKIRNHFNNWQWRWFTLLHYNFSYAAFTLNGFDDQERNL